MPAPPVTIYVTSLTSQAKVRKNIELLHRALRGFEIPYETFDLVMDEDAKRRWQRAKPPGVVVGLPGYLVGGEYIGDMDDFEYAVESGTLEAFLKQDMDHADASQTIGEAELDRLMREMTDADLDQLVGDLHVKEPVAASTATAEKSVPAATAAASTSAAASPVKSTSSPTSQPASAVSEAAHASPTEAVSAATQAALSSPSGSQATASPTTTSQSKAASPVARATTSPSAPTNPTTTETTPPSSATAPEDTGILAAAGGVLASAATAVSDAATSLAHNVEETAAHATDAAKEAVEAVGHNEGPAPGEKTLDDVIDETMAKEKAQAEEKDKAE